MSFDKAKAQDYVNALCKSHRIKIVKWRTTSCGRARYKTREIEIPKPTNVDRLGVCLHEISHIINRKGSKTFEKEFYADKYALDMLAELGYDTTGWINRMKWHIVCYLAKAHNRSLNHNNINADIRAFLPEIDFTKWIGNKVFAGTKYYKEPIPENIEFTVDVPKSEIERLLSKRGMWLEKSQRDDSTYNRWLVCDNGNQYGSDFGSLSEIVNHYQLTA